MSLLREIFEDIKDLGEYATLGFYHEVIKGKDNYIPTYEKNRMANSMVTSARHTYNQTKDSYQRKFTSLQLTERAFHSLKESCLQNEMAKFERYVASASLSNRLQNLKQHYFQFVPVKDQFSNRYAFQIPEAPRTNFELYAPFLLFRTFEAESNLSEAKILKNEILQANEELKLRITALDYVETRIKEFHAITTTLAINLNAVNRKIAMSDQPVYSNTQKLGMVYITFLYIIVSTDILYKGEVSQSSQEVLDFIKSTLGEL
ncbi:hypothetical protein H1D32_07345 [Anaerobacillus sp. CMMVII]|uniref:hypothetical protein n=1 Tax=Anaerobacillus sp. CMMVII TaxID=2755588 RepID=UPI0021B7E17E|nr:hypothetical protein [Anaerobacillus sp. CMMVII]MCT8137575.1 hypothetical protein [Anaerobacillus sp. CMMVII]